jgi:putative ABC transport system permease protein
LVLNLFGIRSGNFIRLAFLSIVLAAPSAFLLMKQWLAGFAYRIDRHAWIFIVAGLASLLIADTYPLYQLRDKRHA